MVQDTIKKCWFGSKKKMGSLCRRNKKYSNFIKPLIHYNHERVSAIKLTTNNGDIIIIILLIARIHANYHPKLRDLLHNYC